MRNRNDREAGSRGEMIFTMGAPGAGKSYIADREYGDTYNLIDADEFKEMLSSYDPDDPSACHEWSSRMADRLFGRALDEGGRWIWTRTGSTTEELIRDMLAAANAGFEVKLLYVRCSLETSLRRNRRRERTVPEDIVREKARTITDSFRAAREIADGAEIIDNDKDLREVA